MTETGEPRMDLEKLRELSDAATPGPWRLKDRGPAHDFDPVHHIVAGEGPYPGATARASFEDAAFIVAAVEYVRSVLSQPETLAAAWKAAEAALPEGYAISVRSSSNWAGRGPMTKLDAYHVDGRRKSWHIEADSPAAALRNLATGLKEHTDG